MKNVKKITTSILLPFILCACLMPALAQQVAPVALHWLHDAPKKSTGVSWGVPWPQGLVKKNTAFAFARADGSTLPVQTWPLAYWPDGSVKWTGVAAVADSGLQNGSLKAVSTKNAATTALQVSEEAFGIHINTGVMECTILKSGTTLVSSLKVNDKEIAASGQLTCLLQNGPDGDPSTEAAPAKQKFIGTVSKAAIEQNGPLRAVIHITGFFKALSGSREFLPFTTRLYFYAGISTIRMVHTFIFDGDDQKDFIKGLGFTFTVPFREEIQNRHVRFSGEGNGVWAEPVQPLNGRRQNPYATDQAEGKRVPNSKEAPDQKAVFDNMASWNDYKLVQGGANGFHIQKRTNNASSYLDVAGGKRATGLAFVGDASGGLALSLKNFWQSYPAALEITGARTPKATINLWLWSPFNDAMDLRHYDTAAHDLLVTYEDVQPGFSTPYGIARTSEILINPYAGMPSNQQLADEVAQTNNTPLLVTTPQYLHSVGVFGLWSLPDRSTEGKRWIEDQLDNAIRFYQQEIDHREWYGFWNYGDVMHTYDAARHAWKYDIGGFAWDNTELSTDIWLWYSYLRTGKADIFKMAEAMTRHTSEVDCYHSGPMAGLGSRHNVNHWGDGSKEVRESQAILRRYYYYLTTDERTGDIMHETAMTADSGLAQVDPLREILPKSKYPTHIRFGPDWTGLVGNWMTEWERTGDLKWKNKILVGLTDFAKMPYGFFTAKGKDAGMGYDPATNHLYQLDPKDIGALTLATMMGGMETAYELGPLLNNKDWNRLYLQYASLYGAPLEEVQAAFGKDIKSQLGQVQGDFARQPAYAYYITKDPKYAKRAWDGFLPTVFRPGAGGREQAEGSQTAGFARFDAKALTGPVVLKPFNEIRNVSTNSTAQWCLNAIELLQMAGDHLPEHHPAWNNK